jgi:hypothetical protein
MILASGLQVNYVGKVLSKPVEVVVGQTIRDRLLAHLGHDSKHFSRKTSLAHLGEASTMKRNEM